ncbi:MAG: DUF6580 family putative transport protein [Candidatus Magasanikbacteria bacterium]
MSKSSRITYHVTHNKHTLFILMLIVVGISARLLPHPANFSPVAALAIFGSLYLPRKWALVLPLSTMFLSDSIIGFYSWQIMASVYASFIATGLLALWARKHKTFRTVLGTTIFGSIIFFLATNAAVWAFGTMYVQNFSGLLQSYYMALPFFRNSLLGDLFFVGMLVGLAEFILQKSKTYSLTKLYER